jgi:hypothetical protein
MGLNGGSVATDSEVGTAGHFRQKYDIVAEAQL